VAIFLYKYGVPPTQILHLCLSLLPVLVSFCFSLLFDCFVLHFVFFSMPPQRRRTRRSGATAPNPADTNENGQPTSNTTHTRDFFQEQPNQSVGGTTMTRKLPVILEVWD
jgi:hypothetical protein